MICFEIPNWRDMFSLLGGKREDVYDTPDKDYGLEDEPHVTLLWGIHDDKHSLDDVKYYLPSLEDMSAILIGVSHFDGEEYDVLKIGVDAPRYHDVNADLTKNLECTNTFPTYTPHLTVAYLKKGMGGIYTEANKNKMMQTVIAPSKYKYGYANGKNEFFTI